MVETPHTEHNSCNPARNLAVSYATVIRRETKVPNKELSQQLSQASPLISYICPVLSHLHWPRQLFLRHRITWTLKKKRPSFASERKNWSSSFKKKKSKEGILKPCNHGAINLHIHLTKKNVGLPQKIQTEHTETPITKSETCYINKIKKRTMRLVFWNSLATESVRCNEKRRE